MRNVLRAIAATAVMAFLVASTIVPSDAAPRAARTTIFDGLWSVEIVTNYGDCSRAYRYPLRIADGWVIKADNDSSYQVAGAVGRNGAIGVTVAGGGQAASGTGRLAGNYGQGRWRTANGECGGVWSAERRG